MYCTILVHKTLFPFPFPFPFPSLIYLKKKNKKKQKKFSVQKAIWSPQSRLLKVCVRISVFQIILYIDYSVHTKGTQTFELLHHLITLEVIHIYIYTYSSYSLFFLGLKTLRASKFLNFFFVFFF